MEEKKKPKLLYIIMFIIAIFIIGGMAEDKLEDSVEKIGNGKIRVRVVCNPKSWIMVTQNVISAPRSEHRTMKIP